MGDEGPRKVTKVGTILWSVLISVGALALGVSILMPSTKRARFQFVPESQEQPATAPTTAEATTGPAATQP